MPHLRFPGIAALALALGAIASGVALAAVSPAAARPADAATAPQRTVSGSLIRRPAHTVAPGTKVNQSHLGERVFVNANDGFALAAVGQAQYPAATTNGGKAWKTDGPALHIDALQAPLGVTSIGALNRRTAYAYGSGQVVDTTSDGGKKWYGALFNGVVMAVVPGPSGHLVAFIDGPAVTWQYVSKNGGRSWRYTTAQGAF